MTSYSVPQELMVTKYRAQSIRIGSEAPQLQWLLYQCINMAAQAISNKKKSPGAKSSTGSWLATRC